MEKKKNLIKWIKTHKRELIISGISITALIALVLGANNGEFLNEIWESLLKKISKSPEKLITTVSAAAEAETTASVVHETIADVPAILSSRSEQLPFEVSKHIRNLPDGWKASAEKIATALENGIILEEGQTWVDNYMKGEVLS